MDKIVKSFGIIKEMLEYRGVDTTGISTPDILSFPNLDNNMVVITLNDTNKIIYRLPKKLSTKDRKMFLEELDTAPQTMNIIVVIETDPSIVDKKKYASMPNVQVFFLKELQFNISKHVLVPKHEKIGKNDVENLMKQYDIKSILQLPHISKKDAMARFLGLQNGDVVRITRESITAGEYVSYRVCVA